MTTEEFISTFVTKLEKNGFLRSDMIPISVLKEIITVNNAELSDNNYALKVVFQELLDACDLRSE